LLFNYVIKTYDLIIIDLIYFIDLHQNLINYV